MIIIYYIRGRFFFLRKKITVIDTRTKSQVPKAVKIVKYFDIQNSSHNFTGEIA